MRAAHLAALTLALAAGHASAGDAACAFPWKLDPADLARYDRAKITLKDGEEKRSASGSMAIDGRHLRPDGLCLPGSAVRDDLLEILALSAPAEAADWTIPLLDAAEVRLQLAGPPAADAKGNFVFDWKIGTARTAKSDDWAVRNGTAHVVTTFDAAEGVIRTARVEIAYDLEPVDRKKDRKASRVEGAWTFTLSALRRCRYDGFRKDVDQAIDTGVAHLRTLQKEDGSFEPHGDWGAGTTALCAYTLLACGAPVADPAVEKALVQFTSKSSKRTYELSVGLMALERAYAPPPGEGQRLAMPEERRTWCAQAAAQLEANAGSPGTWSYPPAPGYIAEPDSSNTQYAALGLLAASKLGFEVKEASWTGLVRHFERVREDDAPKGEVALLREGQSIRSTVAPTPVGSAAGFRYRTTDGYARCSMTCAGIASLAIVRSELRRTKSGKLRALETPIEDMISGGWAWLDGHWRIDRHAGHPGNDWHYYALYSLERAGILTDVLRVGGRDWYFQGAVELIERQRKDGSWDEKAGDHATETCFALLFLKRATPPITGR